MPPRARQPKHDSSVGRIPDTRPWRVLPGEGEDGQIHLGDVILEIDGKAIDTAKELNAALEKYHVGDTVKLRIVRDGQQQDLSVVLRASQ